VPAARLVGELVPPPRFAEVRFDTFRPDPAQPSQAAALQAVSGFVAGLPDASAQRPGQRRGRLGRGRTHRRVGPPGIYLDGGFGVGKTHLLASAWHAAPAPKAFATFVELTHLVGALGFGRAVDTLSGHRLLAIDEFELDDPGDTVLVSTLLHRLVDAGVHLAATSNTLPGALGEGRFAAADFLREIQGLAAHFTVIRIDGDDYRHRGLPGAPPPWDDQAVVELATTSNGATLDDFDDLLAHLARIHPSRYGALLDGVGLVCLRGVHTVTDQAVALRLVVLADRLYDRSIPVAASGVPLDEVFSEQMRRGGYRKKYYRATSRLMALARDAQEATRAA